MSMNYKDSVAEKYASLIETRLKSFKKGKNISERNKELILGFLNKCELRDSIQEKRVLKTISTMSRIAEMLGKDLDQTNQQDIENLVKEIKGKHEPDWTRHDYFVCIKKFYKYLEGNFVDFPDKVRWIKGTHNRSRETAEVYLTQGNVTGMIAAGSNSFEKAAFATLYDGGFRYSEWAGIQRKHVNFEDGVAKVTVAGKTGRRVK